MWNMQEMEGVGNDEYRWFVSRGRGSRSDKPCCPTQGVEDEAPLVTMAPAPTGLLRFIYEALNVPNRGFVNRANGFPTPLAFNGVAKAQGPIGDVERLAAHGAFALSADVVEVLAHAINSTS